MSFDCHWPSLEWWLELVIVLLTGILDWKLIPVVLLIMWHSNLNGIRRDEQKLE